jgi:hypothetical protein
MHILGSYQSKDIISHPIECFKRAIQLIIMKEMKQMTRVGKCFAKLGKG